MDWPAVDEGACGVCTFERAGELTAIAEVDDRYVSLDHPADSPAG